MSWEVGHPLRRDGTSQQQRLSKALSPDFVPVDNRSESDLLALLYRLSKQFTYFNFENRPEGNWAEFFPREWFDADTGELSVVHIQQYLLTMEGRSDQGPFLAIIRAFLHLFRFLQDDINQLSGKHLLFYYQQVLRFRRKPAQPDEVHVLFELAKSAKPQHIPVGTLILAGRDALGKTRHYKTQREIIVNHAQLDQVKIVTVHNGQLFANEDPAASGDQWAPFGDVTQMTPTTVGFGIASHLLLLQEGERSITLTMTFSNLAAGITQADFQSFKAEASGKDNWIPLSLTVGTRTENQISISLTAFPDQPSIEAGSAKKLQGLMTEELPVIRLQLTQHARNYQRLATLQVTAISLSVAVAASETIPGLVPSVLQNDQGILDNGSSFQPFGDTPFEGSYLDIGSEEAFSKPLTDLHLQLRWLGLPGGGFSSLYADSYDVDYRTLSNYTAEIQLLIRGRWTSASPAPERLFNGTDSNVLVDNGISISPPSLKLIPALPVFSERTVGLSQGFLRLTLNHDFGHRVFPKLYAQAAVSTSPPPIIFPNPPYTPSIQSISLGYSAQIRMAVSELDNQIQLFHLEPFGHQRLTAGETTSLLPQLRSGNLFMGFKNLQPPQNLHLLFQALEGSNPSPEAIQQEDIVWEYWGKEGWRILEGSNRFRDTTLGLQQPGILAFAIGKDASSAGSPLQDGLWWLKATIDQNPNGAARLQTIHTQAMTAVFEDRDNDPMHAGQSMPPEQATKLSSSNRAIRTVKQPYPSRMGKVKETDDHFFARVSERLRHRQRAITLWDMERLVLGRFLQIYKVKALPHTQLMENGSYSEFRPGYTTVVVIPDWRRQGDQDPLKPRATSSLLFNIEKYINRYTNFFLLRPGYLQVINPRYEEIQLDFRVGFKEGFDSGFYTEVLNEDLRRYLSPWAYDEGAEISFGGKVYKSHLLKFLEDQHYVDFITDLKLFHRNAGPSIGEMCISVDFLIRSSGNQTEGDTIEASTQISILCSANKHLITVIPNNEYPCDESTGICDVGIGCMYINIDFEIGIAD